MYCHVRLTTLIKCKIESGNSILVKFCCNRASNWHYNISTDNHLLKTWIENDNGAHRISWHDSSITCPKVLPKKPPIFSSWKNFPYFHHHFCQKTSLLCSVSPHFMYSFWSGAPIKWSLQFVNREISRITGTGLGLSFIAKFGQQSKSLLSINCVFCRFCISDHITEVNAMSEANLISSLVSDFYNWSSWAWKKLRPTSLGGNCYEDHSLSKSFEIDGYYDFTTQNFHHAKLKVKFCKI